jgi:hypothetical protein
MCTTNLPRTTCAAASKTRAKSSSSWPSRSETVLFLRTDMLTAHLLRLALHHTPEYLLFFPSWALTLQCNWFYKHPVADSSLYTGLTCLIGNRMVLLCSAYLNCSATSSSVKASSSARCSSVNGKLVRPGPCSLYKYLHQTNVSLTGHWWLLVCVHLWLVCICAFCLCTGITYLSTAHAASSAVA